MEARKAIRISTKNLVRFKEESSNANHRVAGIGETKDVSIGGVYFSSQDRLAMGSVVEMEMEAQDCEIKVKAEVVRVEEKGNEYGIGVRFILEDEKTAEMLQNLALLE